MKTSLGDITLELDAEKAPVSTLNFLRYVQADFYKGTIFHRVMPDFMIQGGGFNAEIDKKEDGLMPPIVNEWRNGLKNVRGAIAMARTPDPDSATAQFYINVVDNPSLDGGPGGGAGYAVFGKVIEGMETVDKIRHTETRVHPKYQGGGKVVPVETVLIESAVVLDDYDLKPLEAKVEEKKQAKKEEQELQAKNVQDFLDQNARKEGVETTESGLQYRMLKPAPEGAAKPGPADRVEVHYQGKLMNGTIFDSSYTRNQSISLSLDRVIPGWKEGMQLVGVGGKIELVLPPDLGYGPKGIPPTIPPNSPLIFEVELLRIR